jgi:hypothetical protein
MPPLAKPLKAFQRTLRKIPPYTIGLEGKVQIVRPVSHVKVSTSKSTPI